MKHTPLTIRILGGMMIAVLLLIGWVHPMLTQGECVALIGLSHRGKPYVFGKEGPESFDCSGLTMDACRYFGTELIHSAKYVAYDDQYRDVEGLLFGTGQDHDVDAGLVGLACDDDILCIFSAACFAVFPDIVCALGHFMQVGNFGKQIFADIAVSHVLSPSAYICASIF